MCVCVYADRVYEAARAVSAGLACCRPGRAGHGAAGFVAQKKRKPSDPAETQPRNQGHLKNKITIINFENEFQMTRKL